MIKVRDEKCKEKQYWRYLQFIQETRRQKNVRSENENVDDNASDDNETTNDDVFHDLTQRSDIHHHHIPLVTQILLRKISKFRASIIIR